MNSKFARTGILLLLLLSACVSTKKYQALHTRYTVQVQQAAADSLRFAQLSTRLAGSNDSITAKYQLLESQYLQLKTDSLMLAQNYRRNKNLLDDLFEKYEQLDKSYRQLSGNVSSDAVILTQTISQKEKDLLVLEQKLLAQQARNDKLTLELQEREVRMLAFENSIRKMDKNAADLKRRVEQALLSIKDSTIKIEQRVGKVYISFPETLAYPGPTDEVAPRGLELIRKVAATVRTQPDITLTVVVVPAGSERTNSPEETTGIPRMYDIVKRFVKEGVTSNRVIASLRKEPPGSTAAKKKQNSGLINKIELIIEPKPDTGFQRWYTN